jgi:DNA invertase Pin-like site-specific DNA recombinase
VVSTMKKVIELIRVSTQGQAGDDRASIPAQRTINLRTARTYGLEIVDTIQLVNVSGAAVLRTSEMQRLLKRIEDPTIHGVVVREFSRVMRPDNFADYILLQSFQDTGTVLYLPDGPIDFGSKTGRLMGSIRAAIAGLERTEILERVWSAKEERRKAGKHPHGPITLPFGVGYDREDQRWFYKSEVEKVREAARLFLAGETSYKDVGRKVGIDAFNLRIILRNPVYTGWKVYSKRRDPSSKAIRTRDDGRQGDRPKIERKPEDIIRVKVLEPLISESEFAQLQQIMDLKKKNHWRVRPDHERKFMYRGFLRCGTCGNIMYTHGGHGRAWYVCKSRTAQTRQQRTASGLKDCSNPYMRREPLERCLDTLIGERLGNSEFLRRLAAAYVNRKSSNKAKPQLSRIESGLLLLKEKKQRVLDAYFEDLIDRAERDRRLDALARDAEVYGSLATGAATIAPALSARELADALSVFHEWELLGRADKRRLLMATMPEIHVQDYRVVGVKLIPGTSSSDEISRTGRDSWPQPA